MFEKRRRRGGEGVEERLNTRGQRRWREKEGWGMAERRCGMLAREVKGSCD